MRKYEEWICRYYASHADIPSGEQDGALVGKITRCKDCAEWRLASDGEGECYDGMADGAMTHETDFCSWARRRTDDK